jgi:hypothetical protein
MIFSIGFVVVKIKDCSVSNQFAALIIALFVMHKKAPTQFIFIIPSVISYDLHICRSVEIVAL